MFHRTNRVTQVYICFALRQNFWKTLLTIHRSAFSIFGRTNFGLFKFVETQEIMSFTLHDMGSENFQFTTNVWNWKAALELIKSLDIISEGAIRQMGYNATGVKVEAD